MINRTIYTFSLRTAKILLLLLTGILSVSGLLFTCYATDMDTQLVLFQWDNLFVTLPATAALCAIIYITAALVVRKSASSLPVLKILRLFVLCWCIFIGVILILFGKSVPAGDGYSVYGMAEQLAVGDTSVIHPTQSYLSYYPQQIGLTAAFEFLIRIWNLLPSGMPAYHFIKGVYLLLGCVIILFQEKTVHLLWKDQLAACLYLVLAGLNFPLLMYTSFVYGEIPSFAAISIGFYLLTRLLTEHGASSHQAHDTASSGPRFTLPGILTAAGSLFFLTISVMFRKNSLIFIIAAVIVLILWGLLHRRPTFVLLAALCMACSLAILPCMQKFYEYRSGSTISSGVPAMSYFAMGMQESSRADGWYNGFNFNTYQNADMNTEVAVAVSRDAIRERLAYFGANPAYAVRFYMNKYLSQWADGTYACRQATLATFGGRKAFIASLYDGSGSKYVIFYCNLYQNILYLGVFWFCLTSFRQDRKQSIFSDYSRSEQLPSYLSLIGVLGGFLFHMLWEANARYIFLYGLAMLPCCAKGLSLLGGTISNNVLHGKFRKSSKAHRPDATDTPATAK
ncbi:MAG: hypothetical protein HFH87_03515 [Lachnospiraceae bacterium]|nr:hypothetical protein [Lachnospiraceae bacterium]